MGDKSFFSWDDDEDDNDAEQVAPQNPPVVAPPAPTEQPSEEFVGPEQGPEENLEESPNPDVDANDSQDEYNYEESRRQGQQKEEAKRVGAIAARELAWGKAVRALDSIPFQGDTLNRVREAARNRQVNPIGLAEDLRQIAGRFPDQADDLHSAADKLVMAAKQEAEAGGNIPKNALPLTNAEAQPKLQAKNAEIAAKQRELATSGLLRSPGLQKELAQLRTEQGALANTVAQPNAQPQQDRPPSTQGNIAAHLETGPGGYKNYITSVDDVVKQLNQAGINVNSQNLLQRVPLSSAMAMILKTADPEDSSGWKKLLSQLSDPSGRGEPGVAFNAKQSQGDDPALMEIKQKQQRYSQLMNQLGNMHQSQNWLSAIGMFVTAILVGPKAALMIWGRAAQEHSLRVQLQMMHEDIQQSIQLRQQQQNLDYRNRALAARQQNSQDLEGQRETAALTRMFIGHKLALERAKESHGLRDPDAKALHDEWQDHMKLAGQALHEGTDPTQFDQKVKDAAMQKYRAHQKAAEAITKMLAVPEDKKRAFMEKKNGVPPGSVSGTQ